MKLFAILSVLGLAAAAQLPNSYIPPPQHARTAGGSNFLQAPNSPQNQYLPPGQGGGRAQGAYAHSGQQYQPSGQPQIPIVRYENVNNGDGSYHFDYATGNGIMHQEQGHLNNAGSEHAEQVAQGQYSYTGDDGQQYSVQYKADAGGFQPVGAHLPTPVPIPQEYYEAIARNEAIAAERGQSYDQSEANSDSGHYRESSSHSAAGYSQGQGYAQQGGGRQSGAFSAQSGYHY